MKTLGILFTILFCLIPALQADYEVDRAAILAAITELSNQERQQDEARRKGTEAAPSNEDVEVAFSVVRQDTQQATCISKSEFAFTKLVPSYDLDKLRIPNGGFTWNWTSEWQMTNFKLNMYSRYYVRNRRDYLFTDGSSSFQRYAQVSRGFDLLASNATLWLRPKFSPPDATEADLSRGFMLQMDHLNTTSGVKFTRVMNCIDMPNDEKDEDEMCTTLNVTHGTNILRDGLQWIAFDVGPHDYSENITEYRFFQLNPRNDSIRNNILSWMWPMVGYGSNQARIIYARTHQKPGVFARWYSHFVAPWEAENQMSRNFSHVRAGKFCIEIKREMSNEYNGRDEEKKNLSLHYELLNLAANRVEKSEFLQMNATGHLVQIAFGHLQAGDYQLTLQNLSMGIEYAELCPSKHFDKMMTVPFPDSINDCRLVNRTSYRDLELWSVPSLPHVNATLETGWDSDDWAYVCAQLGIRENQTELVDVTVCNSLWGCKLEKCPHQDKDQISLSRVP